MGINTKFSKKNRNLNENSPKTIIKEWLDFITGLEIHAQKVSSSSLIGSINILKDLLSKDVYNIREIPHEYILNIDNKLEQFETIFLQNNTEHMKTFFYELLENLLILKNILLFDSLVQQNASTRQIINDAQNNLSDAQNILALSNLKGLAASFEYQYESYNSERKFWGLVSFVCLSFIICRVMSITILPISVWLFIFYIILSFLVFLWLNPTYVNRLYIAIISKKPFENIDKYKNRLLGIKIFSFLAIAEVLIIFISLFCDRTLVKDYRIFETTVYSFYITSWHDLIPILPIYISLVWGTWFSIKQYNYTVKLTDAYKYKIAMSLAYKGYSEECDALGKKDSKELLLKEVLHVIADDPSKRNFRENHMPWAELKDIATIFKSKN